jgi:phosphoglycolate phosphatase
MKLILFDIDGTLIRSNGAGRETMQYALEQLFGTAGPIGEYKFSGKTDPRIITDLLRASGVSEGRIREKMPQIYELMAQRGQEIFPQREMRPCAGIPQLLTALAAQEDVLLGLLTGNAQLTAPLKLLAAGIDPAQFRVGAYGSDSLDRNRLPAVGMTRAEQLVGRPFTGADTVIIGDTPADIVCARSGRATAVAVATGWHAADTLQQYKPDFLFDKLTETEMVIESLLGNRT